MPAAFQINNDDIAHAESVLLPPGRTFDDERRNFIKCLKTVDVQAVPGSGKTTTLLAKLLILERHFISGSLQGVLVISHTNTAVNEIRNKIGEICPNLFSYPNHVGTIQNFVDKFLAIPSFVHVMGFRPDRIDADIYNAEISQRYKNLPNYKKNWVERRSAQDPEGLIQNLRFDSDLNLTNGLGGSVVLKKVSQSETYKTLSHLKLSLFKSGILHFEDVFWFAENLLHKTSQLKCLLQNRFKFVFVDEMQDMAMHQHNILEALFGPESGAVTVFQRIGDRDQAIFGGKEIVDTAGWRYRPNTLTFSNSLRLSPANAKILAPFAYERDADFEIRGLGNSIIPPHIIVYDNKSVGRVIEQFAQLIRALKADNQIPSKPTNRYMAVAWNTVWDVTPNPNQGKLRLIDFFPNFRKSIPQKQKDYERLADYLHSVDPTDKTLHSARRLILGAACTALRLSDVVDPRSKRPFTPTTIMSYIRFELSERAHDRITQALLKCSLNLVTHRLESTLLFLRRLLPKLIRHFGSYTKRATDFLKEGTTFQNLGEQNYTSRSNVLVVDGIEVGLGTVHSVKGQTHTATLYIESAYNSDGGKMYESERLAAQFRGERLQQKVGKRARESAKMVYVGFSRPTHLLVFAVHKIRFDQYLKDINKDTWKIIHAYDERGSE